MKIFKKCIYVKDEFKDFLKSNIVNVTCTTQVAFQYSEGIRIKTNGKPIKRVISKQYKKLFLLRQLSGYYQEL